MLFELFLFSLYKLEGILFSLERGIILVTAILEFCAQNYGKN